MTTAQTTETEADQEVLAGGAGTLVATAKAGSVTVLVRRAPIAFQVVPINGRDSVAGEAGRKTHDSYQITFYAGQPFGNLPGVLCRSFRRAPPVDLR